jgi:hypothetical protein
MPGTGPGAAKSFAFALIAGVIFGGLAFVVGLGEGRGSP